MSTVDDKDDRFRAALAKSGPVRFGLDKFGGSRFAKGQQAALAAKTAAEAGEFDRALALYREARLWFNEAKGSQSQRYTRICDQAVVLLGGESIYQTVVELPAHMAPTELETAHLLGNLRERFRRAEGM